MAFDVWIENRTPFAAATSVQIDADGQEVLVAMFSASFEAPEVSRQFTVARSQLPVTFRDQPFGDPARSSNRYEADIAVDKPGIDLIVNGTACAPGGRPVREMQVGLRVGSIRKVLHVMGDRIYDMGAYSDPHPFERMPIVYERAYGGTTEDGKADQRNPVGVGFGHAASGDPGVRTQAPNITYPDEVYRTPSDRPRPAGFGVVGRGWLPRIRYAGTYDQAWIDTQWPLPPKDFDPRHNQCAPEDQQLPALAGNEEVSLVGMTQGGRWDFRLPRVVAPIRVLYDDRVEERAFRPDTVIIEPDLARVTLKARLAFVTRRNAPLLHEIVFGHVTPAFLTARRKRKQYLARPGQDGGLAGSPNWLP